VEDSPALVEQRDGRIEVSKQACLAGLSCTIEIPDNIVELNRREPGLGPLWREATRQGFRLAFDCGFVVSDFLRIDQGDQLRWFYLLTKPKFE
jgi:predicted GNAT superfamily acetyltransferase